jgi:hypothetical protein
MTAMSETTTHPSPQRHRIGLMPLMLGLIAPPAAWVLQLVVNYGLSSHSCFPDGTPRASVLPGWSGVWTGVLVINLIALAIAAATTILSYRNWHTVRDEHPGEADDLVETGEGRTRFIGLAGAISGLGFIMAILLDFVAIIGVPQCGG